MVWDSWRSKIIGHTHLPDLLPFCPHAGLGAGTQHPKGTHQGRQNDCDDQGQSRHGGSMPRICTGSKNGV